jgi:hypothetical protein
VAAASGSSSAVLLLLGLRCLGQCVLSHSQPLRHIVERTGALLSVGRGVVVS